MSNKIFVGGLSWDTNEQTLREFFVDNGIEVEDVKIIIDRETNKSRGFGFVTCCNDTDAQKAIQNLNGTDLDGRKINVKPQSTDGGGGGYRGGNGGGYRGGNDNGGGGYRGGNGGGYRGGNDNGGGYRGGNDNDNGGGGYGGGGYRS